VLEQQVREGLKGERQRAYGLPFLGDNNFLLDRLDLVGDRQPAYWLEKITSDNDEELRPGTTRLTATINRANMSQSRSMLYAPSAQLLIDIPEKAWTEVRYV
jgi:CRISPR-associated protein Cas5t